MATTIYTLHYDNLNGSQNDVLTSGDGVDFVVCVEWDKTYIIKVLGIAKALGWQSGIVKEWKNKNGLYN